MSSTREHVQPETFEFQAEIKQLLNILIHSVYTAKDIFVRELISNATDALEKVRFQQVHGTPLHSPQLPLEIRIETKEVEGRKLLVIADTGIGMTADEVRVNIGTIAKSGTTAFLEQVQMEKSSGADQQPDVNLIGRFGVGFYSVFMAADRVELVTRSAQEAAPAVRWTSDGLGSYTLETLDEPRDRGTTIEIQLRKDDEGFGDPATIKTAIRRYSNFVGFPIFVNGEQVNRTTALWREPKHQITDEQYNEFYKLISHDFQDPQLRLHFSVDAPLQFSALLFIPSASNSELMGFGRGEVSLQLYVKRVLIDGENKDLLPAYLRFVKGVVESADLPLNISRETLQENRQLKSIRKLLTGRLLDLLINLAKEKPGDYESFWRTYGRILKEGYTDYDQRDKLQELLRFNSSRDKDDQGLVSLADYVDRMKEGQKAIYYLSGPSRAALERDARLELFRNKGIEVLYLCEVADEFVLTQLSQYRDKDLLSADQANPDDLKQVDTKSELESEKPPEQAESKAEQSQAIQPVIDRFKEILGERVIDVRESNRLVDSPACLVMDDSRLSGHMDRVLRMMNKTKDLPRRVLELNPKHRLIRDLARILQNHPQDPFVANACEQLFEGAMLVDGYLADPHQLVHRINQVLEETASLKAGV